MFIPDVHPLQQAWNADGTREYNYDCPNCEKDNLWWNPENGVGHCFSCPEGKGDFSEWKMRQIFRDRSLFELDNLTRNPRVRVEPKPKTRTALDEIATWYMQESRGCNMGYLEQWGLTPWYEPETDRVCFPLDHVYPMKTTDAYMSRPTDPDNKAWKIEPPGANKEILWYNKTKNLSPWVVLVEGIFDVLTPRLHSVTIALLGTNLTEAMECSLPSNHSRILVWMDPDRPGRKAAQKIARQLPGSTIIDYHKEPGDCTPDEARKVLRDVRSRPS